MPRIPQSKMAEAHLPGRDGRSLAKPRPVIVIDGRIDHDGNSNVEVAVVTTTPDEFDGIYIPVPWHPSGHCCTRLRKESWACAHWIVRVSVEELDTNKYGYCGPVALKRLLAELRPDR